ncbi:MAG TPA: hypothetical protein VIZ30_00655 [Pseudomonadales bacterium]
MMPRMVVRTASLRVLTTLAVAALQPVAAYAAWDGWARCVVEINGAGYHSKETHTWFVDDVTATTGLGSWHVAGRGNLLTDDGTTRWQADWAINGIKQGVSFRTVSGNGMVSIRQLDAQLAQSQGIAGYTQQSISGVARTPVAVTATQSEWQLPRIEGPVGNTSLTSSSTGSPNSPGWGWNRIHPSTLTESCTWTFLDGATPPPPPNVPPEAVPTGPAPPPPARPPPTLTAAALLLKLEPADANQGARGIPVRLFAQGTHWTTGTVVDFGPDITVTALAVHSPVEAVAVLDVSPTAVPGPRTVRVSTPISNKFRTTNEVVELLDTFRVYPVLKPTGSGGFRRPG